VDQWNVQLTHILLVYKCCRNCWVYSVITACISSNHVLKILVQQLFMHNSNSVQVHSVWQLCWYQRVNARNYMVSCVLLWFLLITLEKHHLPTLFNGKESWSLVLLWFFLLHLKTSLTKVVQLEKTLILFKFLHAESELGQVWSYLMIM
jgi:hypothetical protein